MLNRVLIWRWNTEAKDETPNDLALALRRRRRLTDESTESDGGIFAEFRSKVGVSEGDQPLQNHLRSLKSGLKKRTVPESPRVKSGKLIQPSGYPLLY